MESILTSIKKLLGITEEYEQFDQDIIIHINSVLSVLTQLGVGPTKGFSIKDEKSVQLYDEARTALINRDKGVIRFSDLRNINGTVSLVVRSSDDVSKARGRLRSELGDGVDIEADGNKITLSYSEKQRQVDMYWH